MKSEDDDWFIMLNRKLSDTYTMIPVALEKRSGQFVAPIWDRRQRSFRTIELLARVAKIDRMIVVGLDGKLRLICFEDKEKNEYDK